MADATADARAPSADAGRSRPLAMLLLALIALLAVALVRARREPEATLEPPF